MNKRIAALFLSLCPLFACTEVFYGKVVGVVDGDTVDFIFPLSCINDPDCSPEKQRLRLAEIDTPEKGQPYSEKARQALAGMVFNRVVVVDKEGQDQYNRWVVQLWVDSKWVNGNMVKEGAAWVYLRYLKHPVLIQYQEEAQAAKAGLWALSEAEILPPWEWRALNE